MMRPVHLRHAVLYDVANCVVDLCVVDLLPSGADIAEIGLDSAPALFVSWRTGGLANHPGNIAWGVHYRFDAHVLRAYPHLPEEERCRVCERVREMSRLLDFNYADPLASSLLVVDVDEPFSPREGETRWTMRRKREYHKRRIDACERFARLSRVMVRRGRRVALNGAAECVPERLRVGSGRSIFRRRGHAQARDNHGYPIPPGRARLPRFQPDDRIRRARRRTARAVRHFSRSARRYHFGAQTYDSTGWINAFDAGRPHIEAVAHEHLRVTNGMPVLLKSGHFPPGPVGA